MRLGNSFARPQPIPRLALCWAAVMTNSVALRLKDAQGRDRLVIRVQPDGTPVVQFLDENGKVTSQLPSPSRS